MIDFEELEKKVETVTTPQKKAEQPAEGKKTQKLDTKLLLPGIMITALIFLVVYKQTVIAVFAAGLFGAYLGAKHFKQVDLTFKK